MTVTELRVGTELVNAEQPSQEVREFLSDLMMVNTAHVDMRAHTGAQVMGSPTVSGIMRYLLEHHDQRFQDGGEVINELPFDSGKKYAAKLIRIAGQERILVMGAPDVLLAKCDLDDVRMREYQDTLADMTGRGLRVVLLANKLTEADNFSEAQIVDLAPLGLVGLSDPLRPHVVQAVHDAQAAGVRVVMITGDHPSTAG
jgi:Ca2+-transporting ATPase